MTKKNRGGSTSMTKVSEKVEENNYVKVKKI